MTEDEMVGWHHCLSGQGFEQTPEVDDGQVGLACFSPWGRKKSDTTERPNRIELIAVVRLYPNVYVRITFLTVAFIIITSVFLKYFYWFPLTNKTKPFKDILISLTSSFLYQIKCFTYCKIYSPIIFFFFLFFPFFFHQ